MKTYGVTYIDPTINPTTQQYDVWSIRTLLDEAGKGEVVILRIYDPDLDIEWEWEN